MILRELYEESIKGNHESLSLLIEFLVFEKKALTFDHDKSALGLYFKPNNRTKMNRLLLDYKEKLSKIA